MSRPAPSSPESGEEISVEDHKAPKSQPEVLKLQEVEDLTIGDSEVLIKVAATALNRADTLLRIGGYPPPKGASPYLGLECSGIVEQVGKNVSRWKIWKVCALLSGGGYAEDNYLLSIGRWSWFKRMEAIVWHTVDFDQPLAVV